MRIIPKLDRDGYFASSWESLASSSASSSARSSPISSASLPPPSKNPSTPCTVHPTRWSVTRSWIHDKQGVILSMSVTCCIVTLTVRLLFHEYLWEVVCSYLLISFSSADLFPSLLTPLLQSSPSLYLIKPCTQQLHGLCTILGKNKYPRYQSRYIPEEFLCAPAAF